MITGNPLVQFRAPRGLRRADIENGYFTTQRKDVINNKAATAIYPNNFRYLPNPTLEVHFKLWEDYTGSQIPDLNQRSIATFMKLTQDEHFQVARAKDFEVDPSVSLAWKDDGSGRLTFGGLANNALVLMWCTGESYDKVRAERLRVSDDVQAHARQDEAAYQEKMDRAGIPGRVSVELSEDNAPEPRPTKKLR